MPASLNYRDVLSLLKSHANFVEYTNKGKGGHRMVCLVDENGKKIACCPIPYHGNKPISRNVLGSIKRKFNLPTNFFQSKKRD